MDEGIRFDATLESIGSVKLIAEGGRVTAATASQICDGAAGLMVVNEAGLKKLGVKPLARVHHMTMLGHDPVIMLEAPVPATLHALKRARMKIDEIDLFEVNGPSPRCRWPGSRPPAPIRTGSTSTAARSPWAIRWAARAPS